MIEECEAAVAAAEEVAAAAEEELADARTRHEIAQAECDWADERLETANMALLAALAALEDAD